jgi:hypothetical protein
MAIDAVKKAAILAVLKEARELTKAERMQEALEALRRAIRMTDDAGGQRA